MKKWLLASVLALAGLGTSANRASAWYPDQRGAYPAAVSFPMITPYGYFTNSYYFPWYYPWYQNYNYSHGYYANWWQGGGYASYYGQQMYPPTLRLDIHITIEDGKGSPLSAPKKEMPKKGAGKVSISLPADAKLTFNGAMAGGTGEVRTFFTPELNADQNYEYVLTAEVTREGQTMTATERVIVRAGEVTTVTLKPTATAQK